MSTKQSVPGESNQMPFEIDRLRAELEKTKQERDSAVAHLAMAGIVGVLPYPLNNRAKALLECAEVLREIYATGHELSLEQLVRCRKALAGLEGAIS